MGARTSGSERLARSLTLLRVFLVASGLILAAGAVALGAILTNSLRGQALESSKVSLTQYVDGVLARELVQDGQLHVAANVPELEADLASRRDIFSVKVWRADGTLAWASLAPERIGKRFPLTGRLEEVLETGKPEAEIEALGDEEDAVEASQGSGNVVEVYAPVVAPGGKIVGAYEVYAASPALEAFIADRKQMIWLATGVVFALIWALLALLVRAASSVLRGQSLRVVERSRQLADAYRRLEQGSLEAIETLNLTVEAKDPDTAGHSTRVQRIALALGRELKLTPTELDALRLGALLHDIGKISVPDALLTKPAKLDYWEFAQMKTHPSEGARILAKLSRMRDAVPIVRHHHERWDGAGYPDGLADTEIPLPAAIVGLADAWDAMTMDRPYTRALEFKEAVDEVRANRGSQFAPAVVDAFFNVLQRKPEELGVDDARPALAG
jgi:putative nucleotidyltransferase with HDIG domain